MKVGIWIRVSTEDQAKGESPQHHEIRARSYAEMKGWSVDTIYDLSGVSGKTVIDHSETKRMMRDIASKKIQGIVFSKLARLARNTRELLDFADFFQANNAALISLQEAIDTSTPAGRFFYSMIAAMAQWEREEIVDRVKASVRVRANLGKSLGGQAPYGYAWKDHVLVVDPKEATIRKKIFELFVKYKRKGRVAAELTNKGYRTRSGSNFSDTTIGRLLTDPLAKGLRRSNYTTSLGEGKHWKMKSQDEWVFTEAPAIVSETLWNQANAILEQQSTKDRKPAKSETHPFTGVVKCSCGARMYKPSRNKKYVCYTCTNKIDSDDLETIFHEQLKSYVFNFKNVEILASEFSSKEKQLENEIAILKNDEKELEKKIEQVFELHRKGEIPTNGFKSHHGPLYSRLEAIKAEIPQLQANIDYLKSESATTGQAMEDAKNLYSAWTKLSTEEKKSHIESICESIIVDKEDVEINLNRILPISKLPPHSQYNPRDSCWPPA